MHLILELTVKFIDTQPQHRDIYFKAIGEHATESHGNRLHCNCNRN